LDSTDPEYDPVTILYEGKDSSSSIKAQKLINQLRGLQLLTEEQLQMCSAYFMSHRSLVHVTHRFSFRPLWPRGTLHSTLALFSHVPLVSWCSCISPMTLRTSSASVSFGPFWPRFSDLSRKTFTSSFTRRSNISLK